MNSGPLVLFYTVGYPGSGKTTFSMQLVEKLGATHLYADEIGVQIFRIPDFSPLERRYLYEEMDWQALNHLKTGKSVIYDANINSIKLRDHLRELARKVGALPIGLWLNTPEELAMERLRKPRKIKNVTLKNMSGRNSSEVFYEEVMKDYVTPLNEQNIIELDGTIPFARQFKVFEKKYKEIAS